MECLMVDPHAQLCPDFASSAFQQAWQLTINAGLLVNHEAAALSLTDNWCAWNLEQCQAWDAQVLANEEATEEAQHATEEELIVAQTATAKKCPKMNTVVPGQFVPADLDIQPTTYALSCIESFEYVKLWYFSNEGCADASHAAQSIVSDALMLARDGDALTLQPSAMSCPSTRACKDHDLTFAQFLTAYKCFIQHIIDANWPDVNVASLNGLFTTLEMHPFRRVRYGEATLLLYQSRVWAHWHDRIKVNKGFEIHVVDNTKLNICMVEVADAARAIGDQMVCPPPEHSFNIPLIFSLFSISLCPPPSLSLSQHCATPHLTALNPHCATLNPHCAMLDPHHA